MVAVVYTAVFVDAVCCVARRCLCHGSLEVVKQSCTNRLYTCWREEPRVPGETEKQQQRGRYRESLLDLPTVRPCSGPGDLERGDGQIGVSEGKLTCREAGTKYGRPTTELIPQSTGLPVVHRP